MQHGVGKGKRIFQILGQSSLPSSWHPQGGRYKARLRPGIAEVKASDTGRGCRKQAGQTQKCLYTMVLPVYARYSEIYGELGRQHADIA